MAVTDGNVRAVVDAHPGARRVGRVQSVDDHVRAKRDENVVAVVGAVGGRLYVGICSLRLDRDRADGGAADAVSGEPEIGAVGDVNDIARLHQGQRLADLAAWIRGGTGIRVVARRRDEVVGASRRTTGGGMQ